MFSKTIAVIPCLDEAKFIGDIVTRAKRHADSVVVSDDCSIDGTSVVAQKAGAVVVGSIKRQGFGGNVKLGINAALSSGASVVVTLDGDGQNNPDEIPVVIAPILNGEADLVIGSRFTGKSEAPKYRRMGIGIITWLYNVGHRERIVDAQSCFRAYKREVLEVIDIEEMGYGFSTESLIKARTQGFRIKEVSITCIYHSEFRMNSSMNPLLQGIIVALVTAKWRWKLRNGGKHWSS